ncbi:MAG: hypothetical protein AMXMBFR67_23150 [Nitrospira sp.]
MSCSYPSRINVITQDRILQVIQQQSPRHSLLFALMDEVGLRLTEALALTPEDFAGNLLTVNNSWNGSTLQPVHRPRTIQMSSFLAGLVSERIQTMPISIAQVSMPRFLFADPKTGKPWTRDYLIAHVWRPALRELDLVPVPLQVLRINAIVRRYRNGESYKSLARMAGISYRGIL